MRRFTIAYNREIIPNHLFRNLSMAQEYLKDREYQKIKPTQRELAGIVYTSRAEIVRIRSEKGKTKKSNQQTVKE